MCSIPFEKQLVYNGCLVNYVLVCICSVAWVLDTSTNRYYIIDTIVQLINWIFPLVIENRFAEDNQLNRAPLITSKQFEFGTPHFHPTEFFNSKFLLPCWTTGHHFTAVITY